MQKLILIRHCQAEGNHKDSPLTNNGVNQAWRLAEFFKNQNIAIDRIISSPCMRAVETITPYSRDNHVEIEIDVRLTERMLSAEPVEDWLDAIETSFGDLDYSLPGGESSNDALNRILKIIEEIKGSTDSETVALVTHRNLLALLLAHYDSNYGFKQWRQLKKPDVFIIEEHSDSYQIKHVW